MQSVAYLCEDVPLIKDQVLAMPRFDSSLVQTLQSEPSAIGTQREMTTSITNNQLTTANNANNKGQKSAMHEGIYT